MFIQSIDALLMRGELYTMVYDKSIDAAVHDGKYDYAVPQVSDKYFAAQTQARVVDFRLVGFKEEVHSETAIIEMFADEEYLQPATLPELLTFGSEFPDIQRKFPIVALGSGHVFGQKPGVRQSPYLSTDNGKRTLQLGAWDFTWSTAFRFLAVEFVL
jgi:hypothetical protein